MAIRKNNITLRNLENRLRAFKEYLPEFLEASVRSQEQAIVSAVTDSQLFREGINGLGVKIKDYRPYTLRTIKKKARKGQPTDRVTLRDTGKFHESMFIVFDSEGFYITSNDEKAKWIVKRYGEAIYRLTDQNLTRIVKNNIREELIKRIKQAIKG